MPALDDRSEIRPAGHSAPLMSPGAGLRPTPPPWLRCAERPTGLIQTRSGGAARGRHHRCLMPRTSGGRAAKSRRRAGRSPDRGTWAESATRRPWRAPTRDRN